MIRCVTLCYITLLVEPLPSHKLPANGEPIRSHVTSTIQYNTSTVQYVMMFGVPE